MTDVDFNMMPVNEARGRLGRVLRAKAAAASGSTDLKLSVHVSMQALKADWQALEGSNIASLHQSFEWCSAWSASHGNQLLLVRGAIGDRTVFILPLELIRGRFFRAARFIGAPHSNINTGLFCSDFAELAKPAFAKTLIAELSEKLARVADIVTLEKMPFQWRGSCHPLSSLPAVRNQNASYQLPLFPSFDETLAQLNAKRRRKKFRVSEKRLEALGGYQHIVARTPEESDALLSVFFHQKAVRFKALGLPNVFQDNETQTFFKTLAKSEKTAESQPLELHAIRLAGENEGRIIAIAGVSRKGDHVICQFGSIDEDVAPDSSPGELLFFLMIRDYCASGVSLFDFGIGDQPYKRSWCTQETIQRDIVLPLTLRGNVAAFAHRMVVYVKSVIKKNRKTYAFVQRWRQRRQAPADVREQSED